MAYEKQTFVDEETILCAEHLIHMEEGIAAAHEMAENLDIDVIADAVIEKIPPTEVDVDAIADAVLAKIPTMEGVKF